LGLLGLQSWEAGVPRTLAERAATFGRVETFGWFVLGALLLIVGVLGVVTVVIALREARRRERLEALKMDTGWVRREVQARAELDGPGSEGGDPTC